MTRVIIAQLPVSNNIAELPGLALGRVVIKCMNIVLVLEQTPTHTHTHAHTQRQTNTFSC